MIEYIFLFVLVFVWIVFATVQDMKSTEIANWLSFSLIAFVLAYRAFYAIAVEDVMFFVYGVIGVLVFTVLGYGFYYSKIFGGGDVKLLMGIGGALPYSKAWDYLVLGGGFVFLLFAAGVVWSLIYSVKLVRGNRKKFGREFKKMFGKNKMIIYLVWGIAIVLFFASYLKGLTLGGLFWVWLSVLLIGFPMLYIYVRSLEKSCMIVLKSPGKLIEGDWLDRSVRISKGLTIGKSVHGLSVEDIRVLKRARKKVWVKEGVPFTPAFVLAFLIGIWLWMKYFV